MAHQPDPARDRIETTARRRAVLSNPLLNRGTAFTHEERRELDLVGLVPPRVLTLDQQVDRAYQQYGTQPSDLAKNVYLTALHDRNSVLFYRLIGDHLAEMLPIVYMSRARSSCPCPTRRGWPRPSPPICWPGPAAVP
ncbi:malate dehydrogenase (oxaloacetate-decarboxylating) [Actinacidiphila paucisporea]|uniref:Malate dehydrogenase (Oxaloacetate-decarboxylating) n=1 Tax=Actinacidiphila paucisporea TaxID=310782 RepID=A0A1M7H3H8_9ACTN|nr:malate dehydrogenase (oxaloacetate-decarboxylating) [Actinacidiphila paucisporea]